MSKKHIGYGGTPFDSKAEAKASYRFAEFGCFPAKGRFSQTFTDSTGTEFRACPDFYHAGSGLFLEFKTRTLNGVTTVATSDSQLASKLSYNGMITDFDRLELGWNHAWRKHAIVQKALTSRNYVVVFEKPVPMPDAMIYLKAGIMFCTMNSLPSYLGKVQLAKNGLNVPFSLHYDGLETEDMTLTLA